MNQAATFMAWHYASVPRFLQMLKLRAIVPRAASMVPGASWAGKPVVWFSVDDYVERCGFVDDVAGDGLDASAGGRPSQVGVDGGLVRLGVPVRTLLTCAELRRKAMVSPEAWSLMCEDARVLGADPDQWFGCLHRVPLADCIVEVRDEDDQWRRMQRASQPRGAAGGRGAYSSARLPGTHHLMGR